MDADGQHRPDDIERLLSAIDASRADLAGAGMVLAMIIEPLRARVDAQPSAPNRPRV